MYCSKCGTPNADAARFCERCGAALGAATPPTAAPTPNPAISPPPAAQPQWQPPPPAYADPRVRGGATAYAPAPGVQYAAPKSPIVAVLLSFLIPGLGQFYLGDNKKGGIMLGVFVLSVFLTVVVIGFLGILIVWIWSMIDAHQTASRTAISPPAQ